MQSGAVNAIVAGSNPTRGIILKIFLRSGRQSAAMKYLIRNVTKIRQNEIWGTDLAFLRFYKKNKNEQKQKPHSKHTKNRNVYSIFSLFCVKVYLLI